MRTMTDNTRPAIAGTPTFLQWFRSSYGLRVYPIALIILASTLYVAASITLAVAGTPLPVSTVVAAALSFFMVVYEVAKLRRGYGKATAQRTERTGRSVAGGSRRTTSSGDSSYAPMIIPGVHYYDDSPSHGGHSGKGHSDGGHSSHGGYDGGGYSGGSDSGGSSGGDGGGGGGGE